MSCKMAWYGGLCSSPPITDFEIYTILKRPVMLVQHELSHQLVGAMDR